MTTLYICPSYDPDNWWCFSNELKCKHATPHNRGEFCERVCPESKIKSACVLASPAEHWYAPGYGLVFEMVWFVGSVSYGNRSESWRWFCKEHDIAVLIYPYERPLERYTRKMYSRYGWVGNLFWHWTDDAEVRND